MSTPEQRLSDLNIILPMPVTPAATYLSFQHIGQTLVISGQLPIQEGKFLYQGRIGTTLSIDDGVAAAKICLINVLSQAKAAINDLSRIEKTLRLGVYVQGSETFTEHPKVANGASDLLVAILGGAGRHTRVAMGVHALPFGVCVEVEAAFWIKA
jgi:enamine deaminase RidA (YjgF/YER057c/UK114 family)